MCHLDYHSDLWGKGEVVITHNSEVLCHITGFDSSSILMMDEDVSAVFILEGWNSRNSVLSPLNLTYLQASNLWCLKYIFWFVPKPTPWSCCWSRKKWDIIAYHRHRDGTAYYANEQCPPGVKYRWWRKKGPRTDPWVLLFSGSRGPILTHLKRQIAFCWTDRIVSMPGGFLQLVVVRTNYLSAAHDPLYQKLPINLVRQETMIFFWSSAINISLRICVKADGWMAGWMAGWLAGWLAGWMDEWMDGWMDGWMRWDEQMDG